MEELINAYKECLGLSKFYKLTTVKESIMFDLRYTSTFHDGLDEANRLFRERYPKDRVSLLWPNSLLCCCNFQLHTLACTVL